MSIAIRLRKDSATAAYLNACRARGEPVHECSCGQTDCPYDGAEARSTPPAEPGDAWSIVYSAHDGRPESPAGFAICCPKCRQVHYWSSANNCASKRQFSFTGPDGKEYQGWTCDHKDARTSCWTWTVDADGRPITARASLFVNHDGGCGYHGWLNQDGNSPGILSDG